MITLNPSIRSFAFFVQWLAKGHDGLAKSSPFFLANDLLTCVLTLCKAERGAILLREDHARFGPFEPGSAAPVEAQTFRVLALHQMREEETNALLAPMTAPGTPVPSPD